ncbi:SagB/ThcOx family dehydrogenase [Paraburkholderia terrae]|uniref:SagB/ThcOx family dehydrogenase n=1 Tax=Paraburkholderia terrae TaxID=311230 RepID=UPI00296B08D7|nr:SagB/ThcOx family dehydrogenase [Paraburkholderia terrae]MDW3656560.1 SagB/ThcOx family dehydrogenase [Paraburkholderia terrae]
MDRSRRALLEYHERSKHHVNFYAPGPGRLDWTTQPDPFRVFHGTPRVDLPLAAETLTTRYNALRCGALPPAHAFDLTSLAILFELSLGLSAWKSYGAQRWALRCNPSSGNLHPTESYLLCPALPGVSAGVYHYLSREHALEQRAAVDDLRWTEAFSDSGVLVGISSIHWREAWKYGMRAWRYCQHDCGHVIAALSYAATALGWQTRLVEAVADDELADLLGSNRSADFVDAEAEAPDVLLWIGNPEWRPDLERMRTALDKAQWSGRANQLSSGHVKWPDIDSIHRATHKVRTPEPTSPNPELRPPPARPALDLRFAQIARQRRSAVNFDGTTRIASAAFFSMLACLLPRRDTPPWNALISPAEVHAALFVHRVDGLEPGLYMLVRNPGALPVLRQSLRPEWLWKKTGPDYLPLYFLLPYDLRTVARLICCHQDIAADGCFALGMIARFEIALKQPWRYRHLFWECGILGQVLYLEAEAAGVRATGVGCFFDDEMHTLLGVKDHAWQSLYHFTVGGAVDDPRLSAFPPYEVQP